MRLTQLVERSLVTQTIERLGIRTVDKSRMPGHLSPLTSAIDLLAETAIAASIWSSISSHPEACAVLEGTTKVIFYKHCRSCQAERELIRSVCGPKVL